MPPAAAWEMPSWFNILLLITVILFVLRYIFGLVSGAGTNGRQLSERAAYGSKGFVKASGHTVLVNISGGSSGVGGTAFKSSAETAAPFDYDICHGQVLFLHKPVDSPECMKAGNYPYAEHLHGRKRLWEHRLQLTFRETVRGQIFFGVERGEDRYRHVPWVQRMVAKPIIASMMKATNNTMYQTYGDDPATVTGELEKSHAVFPLWVMDQLIVTPEGEERPCLSDPNFPSLGITKSNNRKKFRETMDALEFKSGTTVTFGFWCIAQFCDSVRWQVKASEMLPAVGLKDIGTFMPGVFTMYVLKPLLDNSDKNTKGRRHLDSQKVYLHHTAFWSSLAPPDAAITDKLLLRDKKATSTQRRDARSSRQWCCM